MSQLSPTGAIWRPAAVGSVFPAAYFRVRYSAVPRGPFISCLAVCEALELGRLAACVLHDPISSAAADEQW